MKKLSAFLLALVIYAIVHEGMHALVAMPCDEFEALHLRTFGLEVTFRTAVGEREGIHWALISGAGNLITILSGYLLLAFGGRFARLHSLFLRTALFYLTAVFLFADPLNLSIGPFIYGGDANGIAVGLGINRYVIQIIFLFVFLVNRELVIRNLFPVYDVQVRHILFRPWTPWAKKTQGTSR
jgi:hypothetical protein